MRILTLSLESWHSLFEWEVPMILEVSSTCNSTFSFQKTLSINSFLLWTFDKKYCTGDG